MKSVVGGRHEQEYVVALLCVYIFSCSPKSEIPFNIASIFLRATVPSFKRVMILSSSPPVSTTSQTQMSRFADSTHSARISLRCPRKTCAPLCLYRGGNPLIIFSSFTRDQVPVSLTIYLKWQLTEPLKVCLHPPQFCGADVYT
jgi:hypothetical protein